MSGLCDYPMKRTTWPRSADGKLVLPTCTTSLGTLVGLGAAEHVPRFVVLDSLSVEDAIAAAKAPRILERIG